MKPAATRCVTLIGALACCLCLGAVASPREKEVPKIGAAVHASLAAYPQALISLKDPKTGMIFYVESNGRRLVAFEKDGAVAWSVDVMAEAKIKPAQGEPVIRHLRLQGGALRATCGKGDEAKVAIKTGKTEHVGADFSAGQPNAAPPGKGDTLERQLDTALRSIEAVKEGSSRRDLLKLFEPAAGLRTTSGSRGTFVFRDCHYIHLDVEFRPAGKQGDRAEAPPDDIIVKMSRPYIARPVSD